MNKQKVKAFTIMEVTIAMLIASVVVGMAYTVFTIVINSYRTFNNKNNAMAVVLRVDELMRKDFAHAEAILKTTNGVLIKGPDGPVVYEIAPTYIVRTVAITDTFKVMISDLTTSFEEKPVDEAADTDEANRVDDLAFNLVLETEKISYHYHKHYSSEDLIQRK